MTTVIILPETLWQWVSRQLKSKAMVGMNVQKFEKRALHPVMEKLYGEYKELRKKH